MKAVVRVENILRSGQEYRDSDKKLLLAYWEQQGLFLSEAQRSRFMRCTAAETITRARRALKDKYPASDEIDDARFKKFSDTRSGRAVPWLDEEDE